MNSAYTTGRAKYILELSYPYVCCFPPRDSRPGNTILKPVQWFGKTILVKRVNENGKEEGRQSKEKERKMNYSLDKEGKKKCATVLLNCFFHTDLRNVGLCYLAADQLAHCSVQSWVLCFDVELYVIHAW